MKVAMNYKKYLILLSFSLMFTNVSCNSDDIDADRATVEEIFAVEEIPSSDDSEYCCDIETEINMPEEDADLDLDDLNTADVNALLEQVIEIEKQPHDTTMCQKLALVRAFFEMQFNNAWDEFKTDPIVYSFATASIIASAIALIYAVKALNSESCKANAK